MVVVYGICVVYSKTTTTKNKSATCQAMRANTRKCQPFKTMRKFPNAYETSLRVGQKSI